LLGNLIEVCLFGDNIQNATEIIMKLKNNENEIIGVPDSQNITNFLNYCINKNYFNEILVSIISLSA
jgi:hypothetical protein